MLEQIYSRPARVYVICFVTAAIGLFLFFRMPISLFPQAVQPVVYVSLNSGVMTHESFNKTYGRTLEGALRRLKSESYKFEKLEAHYSTQDVYYKISFDWGSNTYDAERDVRNTVDRNSASWPKEIKDSVWINILDQDQGFFAASFYSDRRSPSEIYEIVSAQLEPKFSEVKDAREIELYNPKEVILTVYPDFKKLVTLGISLSDIRTAIESVKSSWNAGNFSLGAQSVSVKISNHFNSVSDLENLSVKSTLNKSYRLGNIARIEQNVNPKISQTFKTSGTASLILWGGPKSDGNIDRMSNDIRKILEDSVKNFPKDIQYKILVDPSEVIRNSVNHVLQEVFLAGALAVLVLFLFVGNIRIVATSALEIPLSILLAFIVMWLTGMNLNLVSLGGLALAAGMNVDASIVVMENIFRHSSIKSASLTYLDRLKQIAFAVREVLPPLIASTLTSVLVFLPLAYTSSITYAVLGDLAKAIIYSHSLSAVIAVLLVPTIRLNLMSSISFSETKSPFEKYIVIIEKKYLNFLSLLLAKRRYVFLLVLLICSGLVASVSYVLPSLPKELIGKVNSEWVRLGIESNKAQSTREMEQIADEVERRLMGLYSDKIDYTFLNVYQKSSSGLLVKLKVENGSKEFIENVQKEFKNTVSESYYVHEWIPSEMDLPNPPHYLVRITGDNAKENSEYSSQLYHALTETKIYDRISVQPYLDNQISVSLLPKDSLSSSLSQLNASQVIPKISEFLHYFGEPQYITSLTLGDSDKGLQAYMSLDGSPVKDLETLGAFPVVFEERVVPLRALFDMKIEKKASGIFSLNGKNNVEISARLDSEKVSNKPRILNEAKSWTMNWWNENVVNKNKKVFLEFLDPDEELSEAIDELLFCISISFFLIAFILYLQFGKLAEITVVLAAIPFGILGAAFSLYIFKSTLSLNSALGVVLLNGLAVSNSILLVDFANQSFKEAADPYMAVLNAAKVRLRPILMTSLTTILGMLPIALSLGQGGRVLQPLGIVVCGGLIVSMTLTLVLIPVAYFYVLQRRKLCL